MTEHLNTPVVTIPLMVTIGTGTNAGYVDFAINPEDLDPPDKRFWEKFLDSEFFFFDECQQVLRFRQQDRDLYHIGFHVPPTKAHAKMLIHLLTGRTDLWSTPKDRSTMPTDGQGGETT